MRVIHAIRDVDFLKVLCLLIAEGCLIRSVLSQQLVFSPPVVTAPASDPYEPSNRDEPEPQDTTDCKSVKCEHLGACLNCTKSWANCKYGQPVTLNCVPKFDCLDRKQYTNYTKVSVCRYCYQTADTDQDCDSYIDNNRKCSVTAAPPNHMVLTECRVKPHVICIGRRAFYKRVRCNWTSGYKWSTAFLLSVTMGGFGVDRFYLGLWKTGIGKLFSFGGLGVWTLVDVVLIGTGYIGPADGSAYM